jgi:DNA-binding MarR family transcriptional regulator
MRASYRELEQLTGAPITLHRALVVIAARPGITASQLAAALGMKRPAVSHVLKGMAKRAWVERVRTTSDQRSVQLFVAPQGQRIIRDTGGKASGRLQRAMQRLSDVEIDGLAIAMPALMKQLGAGTPTPRRRTAQAMRP